MQRQEFDLHSVPEGAQLCSVSAVPVEMAGRKALRLSLSDAAAGGTPGTDYIDMPTFLVLPAAFQNGTISVDLLSRLRADAPDYARAFAGLAYRIHDEFERFEAIYLRALNGRGLNPPPPRDRRAIQYFAYPDWKFDRLREAFADGRYEAGADVAPDRWISLVLKIEDSGATVMIDGQVVMTIPQTMAKPAIGAVGLWVDIGTEAFFSNLVLDPAA